MLEATEQSAPQAVTRVMVEHGLAGFSSAGACKILKRGISSQTIGPLSDYLGLGKGLVAEYLNLDRSTASRRVAKGQLLPIHSAENVLRLLELAQMAANTFETDDESSAWLRTQHPLLDGDSPLEATTQALGMTWRVSGVSLGLWVPSSMEPSEMNLLINPAHSDYHKMVLTLERQPFRFDPRLF